jgi:hypothetical protein
MYQSACLFIWTSPLSNLLFDPKDRDSAGVICFAAMALSAFACFFSLAFLCAALPMHVLV